eukprot:m.89769 g.89769  ORF g.89769 m.89769 type:complete len:108 (-) comp26328_c1_seq1:76-399(-)
MLSLPPKLPVTMHSDLKDGIRITHILFPSNTSSPPSPGKDHASLALKTLAIVQKEGQNKKCSTLEGGFNMFISRLPEHRDDKANTTDRGGHRSKQTLIKTLSRSQHY